jgi:ATP-dependent RNA helicase RhlE
MFSATYSKEIRDLASRILRNPVNIEVTPVNSTAERVEQHVYKLPKEHKRHLLAHLIDEGNWHQVLVFTRTKHGANRLAKQLESSGIRSAAIHGNKSQAARVRALADFKDNRVVALVATEVAARGLDIKELPHVVNYELPNVPEDYVHRIGRTARAGASGNAVSLVSPDEHGLLKDIERLLSCTIPVISPPAYKVTVTSEREPADERMTEQRRPSNQGRSGRQRQSARNGLAGTQVPPRRGPSGTEQRPRMQRPTNAQGPSGTQRDGSLPRGQGSQWRSDDRRQQAPQSQSDAKRQQAPQRQPGDSRHPSAPHQRMDHAGRQQQDRRQRGGERRRATHPHAR